MKTVVVDYDAGNLRSVETALRHLGVDYIVTNRPGDVDAADTILFPGVGDGAHAMNVLRDHQLDQAMARAFEVGKPILGICVGCQIVFERTEERDATCLGFVPGQAVRFSDEAGLKVPHMGWNPVTYADGHWLFGGIPQDTSFYFVHSFYPAPAAETAAIAWTEYGLRFVSAVEQGSLVAVQFHPEKSGEPGLRVLTNFLKRAAAITASEPTSREP